jgi:hypothetical protein
LRVTPVWQAGEQLLPAGRAAWEGIYVVIDQACDPRPVRAPVKAQDAAELELGVDALIVGSVRLSGEAILEVRALLLGQVGEKEGRGRAGETAAAAGSGVTAESTRSCKAASAAGVAGCIAAADRRAEHERRHEERKPSKARHGAKE